MHDEHTSTMESDLQRTLWLLNVCATFASEIVTAMGRPSGMKATMTDTTSISRALTLMQSGWSFLSQAAQTMTTMTATSVASPAMMTTKRRISRCRLVRCVDVEEDSLAMWPLRRR